MPGNKNSGRKKKMVTVVLERSDLEPYSAKSKVGRPKKLAHQLVDCPAEPGPVQEHLADKTEKVCFYSV